MTTKTPLTDAQSTFIASVNDWEGAIMVPAELARRFEMERVDFIAFCRDLEAHCRSENPEVWGALVERVTEGRALRDRLRALLARMERP